MAQFRKSKKAGLFRVTASKNGLSFSAGAGPVRISKGADGKVRRTISAPGTGIYDTKVVGGGKKSAKAQPSPQVIRGQDGYLEWDGKTVILRHTDKRAAVQDAMFSTDVIATVRYQEAERRTKGFLQFVLDNEDNASTPEEDRKTLMFASKDEPAIRAFLADLSA